MCEEGEPLNVILYQYPLLICLQSSELPQREGEKELHTLMISQWNAGKYVIMAQGGDMLVVASESLALLNRFNMVRVNCNDLHLAIHVHIYTVGWFLNVL